MTVSDKHIREVESLPNCRHDPFERSKCKFRNLYGRNHTIQDCYECQLDNILEALEEQNVAEPMKHLHKLHIIHKKMMK